MTIGMGNAALLRADRICPEVEHMKRPALPEVFEIPGHSGDPGPFPWLSVFAVAAIVIGAAMVFVAANEDRMSPPPQVTVGR
jgi:hypothetical protein